MLTVAKVEASLRKLLKSPDVVLSIEYLADNGGDVDRKTHKIRINPYNGCVTDVVVHELIHLFYERQMKFWGQLEEPLTLAVEDEVVRYINSDPKRCLKWHQLISDKLPK